MTDANQVLREHALEWIAAGLVALFVFSGILFYSFSVDVRSINATQQSAGREGVASALMRGSVALDETQMKSSSFFVNDIP